MSAQSAKFPDIQNIVLGLANLKIPRITKTFNFQTCTHYLYETEIVIVNDGTEPCYVVPGELYPKQVLVDFAAFDGTRKRCVYLPSYLNDQVILRYFFLKLWERNIDERMLLFKAFIDKSGEPKDLNQELATILSWEFRGDFSKEFFSAMWSGRKKIKQILSIPLVDYVSNKDLLGLKKYRNLTVSDLCDSELKEFAETLDENFLLLIQLNEPLPPKKHTEISLRDNKFIAEERAHRSKVGRLVNGNLKYEVEFNLKHVLPHQTRTTFHVKIIPPEGVKVEWKSRIISYLLRKSGFILRWREETIDPRKFAILHIEDCVNLHQDNLCDRFLEKLRIHKRKCSIRELLKPQPPADIEFEVPDVRAQFQENMVYLYFGGRNGLPICNQQHKLLFTLNLKRKAIKFYHFANIFLWVFVLLPTTFWLLWKSTLNAIIPNGIDDISYSLVSEYFWSIILMLLGQSIAAMIDYSRRSVSEQIFLRGTFKLIALLAIIEFLFLVSLPFVLPFFAHYVLN